MVTLESPVTGEVVGVNGRLLEEPGLVGRPGGWLVTVDPFLDPDDDDPEFTMMSEGE